MFHFNTLSLNAGYLKQTSDGLMALVVDWYSLSLANVLFAWRRDTGMTSTFVKVLHWFVRLNYTFVRWSTHSLRERVSFS